MTFAVVIIIAVYLPILFLQGLEGRMFRPMAITVCAALAGSLLLALTMVPMLASFAFRQRAPARPAARASTGWSVWPMSTRVRCAGRFDHRVLTSGSLA